MGDVSSGGSVRRGQQRNTRNKKESSRALHEGAYKPKERDDKPGSEHSSTANPLVFIGHCGGKDMLPLPSPLPLTTAMAGVPPERRLRITAGNREAGGRSSLQNAER